MTSPRHSGMRRRREPGTGQPADVPAQAAASPDSGPEPVADRGVTVTEKPLRTGRRICLGVVTGAHGVRGAVKLKSFAQHPEDVARYGPLEDESGAAHYAVRVVGEAKGSLIARLSGVADRDRAEALRGARLYLPREALPPTESDEYYHADLIGLAAVDRDGNRLGTVHAVHDFGAGDTLEIVRPQGQPVMVPFTRAAVPAVELGAGRIVVDVPEGLAAPLPRRLREQAPA